MAGHAIRLITFNPSIASTTTTTTTTSTRPTSFTGINHLKLPCTNIHTTLHFYTAVLPFIHLPNCNHYTPSHTLFAMMVHHPASSLLLELRHEPEHAARQKGWDPVTWACGTHADLEAWGKWFDEQGVKRSKVFTGI